MAQFSNTALLAEMLTYARPHGSSVEAAFVQRFLFDPFPGMGSDKFGNVMMQVGCAPVLFSSHTDTVHHKQGRQKLQHKGNILSLVGGKRGECLGADDGAGVWLMTEMIRAGVSGLYVFHAGEEHGGLGSAWLAKNTPDLLEQAKCAIAFDRKGTSDVITHQGSRTCSDAFAMSLAAKLDMSFTPDDTGTFTDTANYTDAIGECTNISVGYEGAHSHLETLDTNFLMRLRNVMVHFDPTGLVYSRAPGEEEDRDLQAELDFIMRKAPKRRGSLSNDNGTYDEELIEMCRDYPEVAAKLIQGLGGDAEDMLHELWREGFDI